MFTAHKLVLTYFSPEVMSETLIKVSPARGTSAPKPQQVLIILGGGFFILEIWGGLAKLEVKNTVIKSQI
ncbi:MAG: hypothetical protein IPH28_08485 [Cytophagaceae bacterium]|nr:hypothetical protein [Cytophagaceae bacterium]